MKKMIRSFVAIFMLLMLLAACTSGNHEGEQNEKEEIKDVATYPFSGIEMEEEVNRRAVAVMIDNAPQARPQTGLSQADIVFEMLAESNITRFMAIYQSEIPEIVGPVRSAREYFFSLADGYNAIYVYSGAANFVNDLLHESGVDAIEGAQYEGKSDLFVRERFRKAPHNLYMQFEAIKNVAQSNEFATSATYEPLEFLNKGEDFPGDMEYEDGSSVTIELYNGKPRIEFQYDTETGHYIRKQDGDQTIELESEKPIEIANVLILEAEHKVIDKEGRRDIDMETGGQATLLQQGQARDMEWENRNGRIVPVDNGEVVPLVPGKTWAIFVPN